MKRLDVLIREARERSGNARYGVNQGISQRSFVSYANDAQQRIYNKILGERSSLYIREAFIDVQAGVAVYDLPTDVHLRHNVIKVDYSQTGDARLYSKLELRSPSQEVSSPGYPSAYFLRQGQIVLSPIPQTSATRGLRINYQYKIPEVDIRRASVSTLATIAPVTAAWAAPTGAVAMASIATDGEGFMAVGAAGAARYSADGTSFSATGATGFGANAVMDVAYGNGRWVICGLNGNVSVSLNNSAWASQSGAFAPGQIAYGVAYGNGTFVICGAAGNIYTGSGAAAMTWTSRTSGLGAAIGVSACYNPDTGTFVVAADSGALVASTDLGVTWSTLVTDLPSSTPSRIVYANGTYILVSSTRTYRSADALTWTEFAPTTYVGTVTISAANGVFILGESYITPRPTWVSFNGVDWFAQTVTDVTRAAGTSTRMVALTATMSTVATTTAIGALLNTGSVIDESAEDLESWSDYVTLVNKHGAQLLTSVEALSYSAATGALAITPVVIDAITSEMYLCLGEDSTTHSELVDVAERYLVEYMVLRAQLRSSSGEAADTSPILDALEKEILESIAELEEDLTAIPLLDFSMLDYAEDL